MQKIHNRDSGQGTCCVLRPAWGRLLLGVAQLAMPSLALPLTASADEPGRIGRPDRPRYACVADVAYLQEIGRQVATEQPVTSLAASAEGVYAVVGGALHLLQGGLLEPLTAAPDEVRRLFRPNDSVWCTTDDATYRIAPGVFEKLFDEPFVDMCFHRGRVHGATARDVYRFDEGRFVNVRPELGWLSSDSTVTMADGSQVLMRPVTIGPIQHLASYHDTLHLLRPSGLALLDGKVFQTEPIDWGTMPSTQRRDMLTVGSRLCFATDRGVAILRGAALTALDGEDGLPYEDATCLAKGFDGDLWIGTTAGAIRKVGAA
ncbi:MAG: hypothetical protein AAF961_07250, partial [Planctomycetota bacterium]